MAIPNLLFWVGILSVRLKTAISGRKLILVIPILQAITDWKDDSVHKTCIAIRKYQHALGYSENWMTEYVYNIVLLAKKEPKPKE